MAIVGATLCAVLTTIAASRAAAANSPVDALRSRGRRLHKAARFDEAAALFHAAATASDRHAREHAAATHELAVALHAGRRLHEAAAAYRQVVVRGGDGGRLLATETAVRLHTNLGTVLDDLERPAEAIAFHRHAIAALLRGGDARAGGGPAFGGGTRRQHNVAATQRNLAGSLYRLRRHDEAADAFAAALLAFPLADEDDAVDAAAHDEHLTEHSAAHDNLAAAVFFRGRTPRAARRWAAAASAPTSLGTPEMAA